MKSHIGKLVLALAISLLAPLTTAFAQVDTATVLGTIHDSNGAVLAGVKVTLTNNDTRLAITTQADEKGDYQFLAVKIGVYKITAEQQGFTTAIAENIVVTVNARQRVDLSLKVGQVTEDIVVTSAAQLLEADSSDRSQFVGSQQITSLPLNGRSYANLALLAPGVRESGFNSIIGSPGREASFNVNGLRSTFNNFVLDGLDNNYFGTSNQGFSNQVVQPPPDAVAEFKVQTNTYSAEFGRSGGAVINTSFRSGTNQLHGTVWEFLRNTDLNAVGFFKPAGGVKPTLIRNQFGGVLGGPIKKDRTFFFLDYEGFRDVSKRLQFVSLPTMAQRSGSLGVDIRNPFTGVIYSGGNIPSSDITAFAKHVLADLPAPNLPGTSNNFDALTRTNTFSDKFDAKIDHNFNDHLNGFLRVSHRHYSQFVEPPFPGASGGGDNGNVHVLNQELAGGLTYTLANNSVLDFRVSATKGRGGKNPLALGGASMFDTYGITGLPTDKSLTGGLTTQSIAGFTDFGRQATNPQYQDPSSFNARVGYSWILGRHSLKAGYENLAVNTDVQDINPLYGHDTYNGQFSRPVGAGASNIFSFADFLFGARSQYELGTFFVAHLRQRMNSGYIQDDYKFGPHITFNIGLRYEYGTPYYERDNHLSNYDPTTNSIIQAKDGSIADRALVNPDRTNFMPRFGFAYSINNDTVIRGGYGIGYIHFNRVGSADLLGTNFPQATRSLVAQDFSTPLCVGDAFAGCFRSTQQGYPSAMPDTVVLFIPRDTKNGYVQNWQLSIQRQISKNTVLDVAYVGNHSVKLTMLADLNQAAPNAPGQNLPLQQRRPIPNFATISMAFDGGFANYNALQVRFEHRASRSLYILNSFTWSKAIDNVAQSLENGNGDNPNPQNLFNLAADRGPSSYDQPFNNQTAVVWQVPVGHGRSYFNDFPSVVDKFVGGWDVTLINQMTSGQPINLIYAPTPQFSVTANLPNFIGGNAPRPNLLGDPNLPGDQQTIDKYFNTANIVLPTDPSHPFGNAGRNVARANSFFQLDMGLQKEFPIFDESKHLEFRAEFFNLLNRTNFGPANGTRSSGAFGTIRSTFPARQVQVALKFVF